MTEKKAVYRTHGGKVVHAPLEPTVLRLDGDTIPYEVHGADAGDIAHESAVFNLGKWSNLANGQLEQGSDAELKEENSEQV